MKGRLAHLQVPGFSVAVAERERKAVLARLAIGMDPADVAGAIDPEQIVGREQLASRQPAHQRGQSPKEELHRRIIDAMDPESRPLQHSGVALLAAQGSGAAAEILAQPAKEGLRHPRLDEPFEKRIAIALVAARHLHAASYRPDVHATRRPLPTRDIKHLVERMDSRLYRLVASAPGDVGEWLKPAVC